MQKENSIPKEDAKGGLKRRDILKGFATLPVLGVLAHEVVRKLSFDKSRKRDILAELGQNKRDGQILVGFSMETENLLENARKKLRGKNVELMVANDVSQEGAGFGTDTNIVWIIDSSGDEKKLPMMSKRDVADAILDAVINIGSYKMSKSSKSSKT